MHISSRLLKSTNDKTSLSLIFFGIGNIYLFVYYRTKIDLVRAIFLERQEEMEMCINTISKGKLQVINYER